MSAFLVFSSAVLCTTPNVQINSRRFQQSRFRRLRRRTAALGGRPTDGSDRQQRPESGRQLCGKSAAPVIARSRLPSLGRDPSLTRSHRPAGVARRPAPRPAGRPEGRAESGTETRARDRRAGPPCTRLSSQLSAMAGRPRQVVNCQCQASAACSPGPRTQARTAGEPESDAAAGTHGPSRRVGH